ncbi:hypothetical protein ACNTMW_11565 [Planosporangium sp. 12N6]|uniref:hypothetical protein n=1 Tax=Planosporangium spinosum TaxID=3402278 RepID=UPI003CF6024A
MLQSLDRWVVKAVTGAMALDRWAVEAVTRPITDDVLPAVDRAVQRGRRLLSARRRGRRW